MEITLFIGMIGFASVFVMMSLGYSQTKSGENHSSIIEGYQKYLIQYENKKGTRKYDTDITDEKGALKVLGNIEKDLIKDIDYLNERKENISKIEENADSGNKAELNALKQEYEKKIVEAKLDLNAYRELIKRYQESYNKKIT